MSEHDQGQADLFEPQGWEQRYAGDGAVWSGNANPQLVAEAGKLTPGTALDVGCGEGGDVLWLAQQGWQATGADFSAEGLRRAATNAEKVGVTAQWWQIDARDFDPQGRTFDLVTSHFLHPRQGQMVDVVGKLAQAVAPGGHLLVVGHAPPHHMPHDGADAATLAERMNALFLAADLVPGLPENFEALVVEQRPRVVVRDGTEIKIDDSTLLARRSR